MDIKTFVSETLTQILQGIREAQEKKGGEDIAAEGWNVQSTDSRLMHDGVNGVFTTVDFDISVLAESKEGGGTVRVAAAEISDNTSRTAQNASRVKFSVHVRLPKGGSANYGDDIYS